MTTSDYELLRATTSDYEWLYEPDYEWLRVTTSDYKWLQGIPVTASQTTRDYEWLQWLQATTSDYEPGYKWLQVTTNDYKRLPVKLRMTATGIGNNLRHKNVFRFLWLHDNEQVNTLRKPSTL